jgi:ankyrin repeat protein
VIYSCFHPVFSQRDRTVFIAARQGHADAIRVLAECGADVTSPENKYNGATPLFIAAQYGHADAIVVLAEC